MLDDLKEVLSEQLGVEKEKITEESNLVNDLGADSLDLFQIVMALEDKFGVKIDDEDAVNIKTVGEAIEIITSKLNNDNE